MYFSIKTQNTFRKSLAETIPNMIVPSHYIIKDIEHDDLNTLIITQVDYRFFMFNLF